MVVKVTQAEKEWLRLAEMPTVRQIQKVCRDDELSVLDYALKVMQHIKPGVEFEIHRPLAVVAKNDRVCNLYAEDSANFDVWISFLAFSKKHGAYDCGLFLSDIREGLEKQQQFNTEYSYIRLYTEDK